MDAERAEEVKRRNMELACCVEKELTEHYSYLSSVLDMEKAKLGDYPDSMAKTSPVKALRRTNGILSEQIDALNRAFMELRVLWKTL